MWIPTLFNTPLSKGQLKHRSIYSKYRKINFPVEQLFLKAKNLPRGSQSSIPWWIQIEVGHWLSLVSPDEVPRRDEPYYGPMFLKVTGSVNKQHVWMYLRQGVSVVSRIRMFIVLNRKFRQPKNVRFRDGTSPVPKGSIIHPLVN